MLTWYSSELLVCVMPSSSVFSNFVLDSGLATLDHDHHRIRRAPLNQFFSYKSVRDLQPIIEERVDQLLGRLRDEGKTRPTEPIDVMYPFSAYTNGMQTAKHSTIRSSNT